MLVHGWPFLKRDDGFRRWRSVSERAVRSFCIVVFSPILEDDMSLPKRLEALPLEQLVPEPSVESLDEAILPG
jgi:hypothetical protein